MTTPDKAKALHDVLDGIECRVVACSGGIDSMLLATAAHRARPATTWIAHAVSAAVPAEATTRVREWATREGWQLAVVDSGEFADENYLRNPANRCYFCKTHLYDTLHRLQACVTVAEGATVLSGANLDDLGEYRPGLVAASENGVRHPFVEAEFSKQDIRELARRWQLPFAELAASPCLASRLYTGTRVTVARLRAVEEGEALLKRLTGLAVVRCRIRESEVLVEVPTADRPKISAGLLEQVAQRMRGIDAAIVSVSLDALPYRPGRAFVLQEQAA